MSRLPLTPILEVYPDFYNENIIYPIFNYSSEYEQFPKKLKNNTTYNKSINYPIFDFSLYGELPEYDEFPEELKNIKDIKDYEKLRIVNGCLEIDTRKFSSIRRFLSGDSRWKVLGYLKKLLIKYKENPSIKYFIDKLCNTTYKNDKRWIISIKEEIKK